MEGQILHVILPRSTSRYCVEAQRALFVRLLYVLSGVGMGLVIPIRIGDKEDKLCLLAAWLIGLAMAVLLDWKRSDPIAPDRVCASGLQGRKTNGLTFALYREKRARYQARHRV